MKASHRPRFSKGYKYIYAPDSPNASKSESYKGYIFEHRYVMEQFLGRSLEKDEDVHHIDFNKLNNDISNLMLLKNWEHVQLHHLLKGHQIYAREISSEAGIRKVLKYANSRKCIDCGADLSVSENSIRGIMRCPKCAHIHSRKVERPSKDQLEKDVNEHSYLYLEDKYGVSTNAIKKWLVSYGIKLPSRHENWISDKPFIVTEKRVEGWKSSGEKLKKRFKDGTPCDKAVQQFDKNGNLIAEYRSVEFAARENGFVSTCIARICRGVAKSYKGFVWKYK